MDMDIDAGLNGYAYYAKVGPRMLGYFIRPPDQATFPSDLVAPSSKP